MLRTAVTHFLPRTQAARQISTSSPLFVRIRSQNASGGTSNPNPTTPTPTPSPTPTPASASASASASKSKTQPSVAEAPPSPPPETTDPRPFTPEVHQASPSTSTQTQADPSPVTGTGTGTTSSESNTPLTPPAVEEEIQEPKDGKYTLPSLDIDPEVALPEPTKAGEGEGEGGAGAGPGGKRRTGAGRKEYVSSIERQRKMMVRLGMGVLGVGALGAAWYASQGEANDGTSSWQRLKTNTSEMLDVFNKPAFKTLLPDPLPAPHQRPYTLVIDLEGLLVSSTWDRTTGWRTAKRPGVDYFLAYLSQFYEIVLFTSHPSYTAMPVAEKLDPFTAYLPYRLYRDSTRHVSGKVVKDLSYLNRDLSKVIMIDTTPEHSALQPENAIIIKPWEGKGGERGLVDLIPFLESIGIFAPPDVRPILKAYEGKDIPTEYAKKEAESKKASIEEWERKNPNRAGGTSASGGFLGGMFGSVTPNAQTRPAPHMTYLEQKRAQAQKMYQEEQKYWAENAEDFKKLIEEDKQRQLAEMKGSLLGWIQGAPPKSEDKKA